MIAEFAAVQRIPAIYQATMFAEAGGLMAWAPDLDKQYRIAASYVDQILKGANARAAERIGLTLPADSSPPRIASFVDQATAVRQRATEGTPAANPLHRSSHAHQHTPGRSELGCQRSRKVATDHHVSPA
jgi:hypothetical protein